MSFEQKRNAERLPLDSPILATVNGLTATILELSAIGCKIEHHEKLSIGGVANLRFRWENETIEIRARVARMQLRSMTAAGMVYESGLKFADSLAEAPDVIRYIVASLAKEDLPPQIAPVVHTPPEPALEIEVDEPEEADIDVGSVGTPASALEVDDDFDYVPFDEFEDIDLSGPPRRVVGEYIECRMDEQGRWHRRKVDAPVQPTEGFITTPQDDAELDMLCKTYEYADPDTRRLIRISLELTATAKRD